MASVQLADLLPPFLDEAERAPFQWGEWDCLMMCARWAERVTGSDPVPELRGRYADIAGWRRLAAIAGGMDVLLKAVALRMGAEPVNALMPGDVALVRIPPLGAEHLFGAIYVGQKRFVVKALTGLITAQMPMVQPAYGLRG